MAIGQERLAPDAERTVIKMTVANTILNQLGGNQFLAMTGCKNLLGFENGLQMRIPKNGSKARRLSEMFCNICLIDSGFYFDCSVFLIPSIHFISVAERITV